MAGEGGRGREEAWEENENRKVANIYLIMRRKEGRMI